MKTKRYVYEFSMWNIDREEEWTKYLVSKKTPTKETKGEQMRIEKMLYDGVNEAKVIAIYELGKEIKV